MAKRFRWARLLWIGAWLGLMPALAGCLTLGGKTVVEDSSETKGRLSLLETRVSALEQATVRNVPPPMVISSGPEPILTPRH